MSSTPRPPPPEECPVCGAVVPRNARACPECGADENTGWNEDETRYDGIDLPDTAFEDHSAAHTHHGRHSPARNGLPFATWIIVLLLLAALVFLLLK